MSAQRGQLRELSEEATKAFRQNTSLPWVLALLAGLLLGLSQPKVDAWPLAWIAWVPLLFAIHGQNPKQTAKLAFAAHFVSFLIILYWIEVVCRVFGSIPIYISWIPWVLLSAYCAGYMTLAFWGAAKLAAVSPRISPLWTLPVFLTAAEWARSHVITGFPWGHPAYSQFKQVTLIQITDVVGIDGLLFLLAAVNISFYAGYRWIRERRQAAPALVGIVLLAAALSYGYYRLEQVREAMGTSSTGLTVGLVQGNIDQSVKWDKEFRAQTLDIYHRQTRKAAGLGAELVIWPETAAPFYFDTSYGGVDSHNLMQLARETKTYMLFGAPAVGVVENEERSYNRAYLLDKSGQELSHHNKSHLVPFSEYIPLPALLGWIDKLVPVVGNFSGGLERRALAIPGAKFGTLICYESIFPLDVRDFVRDGANFLTVITNDAWFLRTSATYQHISMAVFRAVENRVPLVQAGNTGITALIDADGVLRAQLPVFETDTLVEHIRFAEIGSFYTNYGDVFAYVTLLVSAVLLAWGLRAQSKGS